MKPTLNLKHRLTLLLGVCCLLLSVILPAQATITVTSLNDSGPGSLRQAIADAAPGDTIDFAVTGTITLTSGELLVDKSVSILGPGPANLALDGIRFSRVFHVGNGVTVAFSGLTITRGFGSGPGGGIYNDHASLTVSNVTCIDNAAFTWGGGIYNEGAMSLRNCSVVGNTAQYGGGGIFVTGSDGSSTLLIDQSVISSNSGGGIYVAYAPMEIRNSIVNSNYGGGIHNTYGSVTLSNCTVHGNSAIQFGRRAPVHRDPPPWEE